MYEVFFCENENGKEPFADYLNELRRQAATSKSSKADLCTMIATLDLLAEKGTLIGEPVAIYGDDYIWELHPLKNRIFYVFVRGNTIILLHHFLKRTEQNHRRELKKAQRNLNNLIKGLR